MDPDNVLDEDYNEVGDSESEDELVSLVELELELESNPDEVDHGNAGLKLGISAAQAKHNYDAAGTEVDEEKDRITLAGNAHLIDEETDAILDNIVKKIEMRYDPAEFQRVAINALGGMKNVVLISPTGQTCTILNI